MDITFLSLFLFSIVMTIYFNVQSGIWGIQSPTMVRTDEAALETLKHNRTASAVFVAAVALSQFVLNMFYLLGKCGGPLSGAIAGTAAAATLLPWAFLFGAVVLVLFQFPALKSAFANVLGYFVIAGAANDILARAFPAELHNQVEGLDAGVSKTQMTDAAEAVLRIMGNRGVLVNTFTVENFNELWGKLELLMINVTNKEELKDELFKLVVRKEMIGEGCWYFYTAVLVASVVYYTLSLKPCVKSPAALKKDHDAYLKTIDAKEQAQPQPQPQPQP
jgi:hypothetical protein